MALVVFLGKEEKTWPAYLFCPPGDVLCTQAGSKRPLTDARLIFGSTLLKFLVLSSTKQTRVLHQLPRLEQFVVVTENQMEMAGGAVSRAGQKRVSFLSSELQIGCDWAEVMAQTCTICLMHSFSKDLSRCVQIEHWVKLLIPWGSGHPPYPGDCRSQAPRTFHFRSSLQILASAVSSNCRFLTPL